MGSWRAGDKAKAPVGTPRTSGPAYVRHIKTGFISRSHILVTIFLILHRNNVIHLRGGDCDVQLKYLKSSHVIIKQFL